jgi:hypothetical protein
MKFFPELVTFFYKYKLPWEKMVGFVSDGKMAMIDKKKVLQQNLKTN